MRMVHSSYSEAGSSVISGSLATSLSTYTSSGNQSQIELQVLQSASFWVYSNAWHCSRPSKACAAGVNNSIKQDADDSKLGRSAVPQQQDTTSVQFKGPVTSAELASLYRARKLKGSILVLGLADANACSTWASLSPSQLQGSPIASMFRTLAHLFEMAKNGVSYTPVDSEGLLTGYSAAHWARPLWSLREAEHAPHAHTNGKVVSRRVSTSAPGATDGVHSDDEEEARCVRVGEPLASAGGASSCTSVQCQDDDQVVRLFQSADKWCYLYSHEAAKSKKTPPKPAQHLIDMYRDGCLPDWLPMLGLRDEVAHFNSLPPSLFTTLAALISVMKAGLELQPVGIVELHRYDKFIENRSESGSTLRTPNAERVAANQSSSHAALLASSKLSFSPAMPGMHAMPSATSSTVSGNAASGANGAATTHQDSLSPTLNNLPPVSRAGAASGRKSGSGNVKNSPARQSWTPTAHTSSNGNAKQGAGMNGTESGEDNTRVSTPNASMVYNTMTPNTFYWGRTMPTFNLVTPTGSPSRSLLDSRMPVTPGMERAVGAEWHQQGDQPVPGSMHGYATQQMQNGSNTGGGHRRQNSQGTPHRLSATNKNNPFGNPAAHAALSAQQSGGYMHGSVPSSPMPGYADGAMMPAGFWAWPHIPQYDQPTAATAPIPWTTPVFRLFTADAQRGQGLPAWWCIDHRGVMTGPFNCEHMICEYSAGNLHNDTLICGTFADVTPATPPALHFFQDLGTVMQKMEEGGEYVLVKLSEVLEAASSAPASLKSPTGVRSGNARPGNAQHNGGRGRGGRGSQVFMPGRAGNKTSSKGSAKGSGPVHLNAGDLTQPKLSFSHEGIPAVSSGNTAGSARSTGTGSMLSGSTILKGMHSATQQQDGSCSAAEGTATASAGTSDGGVSSSSSAGASSSATCSTAHDDVIALVPALPGDMTLTPRDQLSKSSRGGAVDVVLSKSGELLHSHHHDSDGAKLSDDDVRGPGLRDSTSRHTSVAGTSPPLSQAAPTQTPTTEPTQA